MNKVRVRCLSDMGGILHDLFDFALSHKVWHTGVALVTQVSGYQDFLKAEPFLFCFSQFKTIEADVTGCSLLK